MSLFHFLRSKKILRNDNTAQILNKYDEKTTFF